MLIHGVASAVGTRHQHPRTVIQTACPPVAAGDQRVVIVDVIQDEEFATAVRKLDGWIVDRGLLKACLRAQFGHMIAGDDDATEVHRPSEPIEPQYRILIRLEAGVDTRDIDVHPPIAGDRQVRVLELQRSRERIDVLIEMLIERAFEWIQTRFRVVVADFFGRQSERSKEKRAAKRSRATHGHMPIH